MPWETPPPAWTDADENAYQQRHKSELAEAAERQRITALARGFVAEARQQSALASKRGHRGDDVTARVLAAGADEVEKNARWPVHRVINSAMWVGKYQNLRAHLSYQGKTTILPD